MIILNVSNLADLVVNLDGIKIIIMVLKNFKGKVLQVDYPELFIPVFEISGTLKVEDFLI